MKEHSQRKYLLYAALEKKYIYWSQSHCREIPRNDRKDEDLKGERQCKVSLMLGESGNFLRTQANP